MHAHTKVFPLRQERILKMILPMWLVVLMVILLQTGSFSKLLFARPDQIFVRFVTMWWEDGIFASFGKTLMKFCIALPLSVLVGVPIGLLISHYKIVRIAANPYVTFFRSVPITYMTSLFSYALGFGIKMQLGLAVFGATLVVIESVVAGVDAVPSEQVEAALLDGATPWVLATKINIYTALPAIWVGMSIAANLVLVLVSVTEMFVGGGGIGMVIRDSSWMYDKSLEWALIILSGIMGLSVTWILQKLRGWVIDWEE